MKTAIAASVILVLSAAPAFAQGAGVAAPAVPTPHAMSARNPNTVNPLPDPGAGQPSARTAPTPAPAAGDETPTSAAAIGPEATTGAPAGPASDRSYNAELRRAYPVCRKVGDDSCRIGPATPPDAR